MKREDYYHLGVGKPQAEQTIKALKESNAPHYVYILYRPDGSPFYVGKGQNMRVFGHEIEARGTSRISHKLNIIRKIITTGESVLYSIPAAFECHQKALTEEMRLIALIGRYDKDKNFPLTNQTDGGEGALNPSEEVKERHRQTLAGLDADNPDVAIANKFLADFCKVESNPIKAVSKYGKSVSTLHKNRDSIGMKPRNAGALVAMAVAQSVILSANAELSRWFAVGDIEVVLENGCGRDMLVNGMIELSDNTPKHETLRITKRGFDYIMQAYPREQLISFGILPE